MHELSIAESILQRVALEAERRPGARFLKVGVRVGELSGVDPDALSFGFEILVKDTPWNALTLEIQHAPRVQRCCACRHEFTAPDSVTVCPQCGHGLTTCIGGDELDVVFMELQEEDQ
jgi:hydrogenase nickel incorporation protein HypA/HybF